MYLHFPSYFAEVRKNTIYLDVFKYSEDIKSIQTQSVFFLFAPLKFKGRVCGLTRKPYPFAQHLSSSVYNT